MSIKLQLQGTVYQVGSPNESKTGYINQDMILHVPSLEKQEYDDHYKIEWNQKGIQEKISREPS